MLTYTTLFIEYWQDPQSATFNVAITLSRGYHRVRLEYYEASGLAGVRLNWGNISTPTPTTTNTPLPPTPTRTPTSTSQTGLRIYLPLVTKWTPWCDQYEPNNNRRVNPWGPLQSSQLYQAKLCTGDAEDNYYFDAGTTNPVQIRLQLPSSLVNHTAIWLYAKSSLDQPICGTGPVTTADYNTQCPISQAGQYIIRLCTDGASDNMNTYTLQATFQ